jgi:hypothetical protein
MKKSAYLASTEEVLYTMSKRRPRTFQNTPEFYVKVLSTVCAHYFKVCVLMVYKTIDSIFREIFEARAGPPISPFVL